MCLSIYIPLVFAKLFKGNNGKNLLYIHDFSLSESGQDIITVVTTAVFFFVGYYGDGLNAIVVFAVCFMPESSQPNYRYLMDNLFK